MRFRTITAPNMQAAMTKLRAQMGADAIILNTEQSDSGHIILRAAVEQAGNEQDELNTDATLALAPGDVMEYDSASTHISDALSFHRLPEHIKTSLMHTVDTVASADAVFTLAAAFDNHFRFAPLPHLPPRPIMLIGPAGAGKTLTAAKLTARSLLAGNEIMLVSTDIERTGGSAQLEAYAKLMQRPLHTAADGDALARVLQDRNKNTACIIDTAGTSPFNLGELHLLKSLIMSADVEPVLVLSAGGDAAEACEIVNLFSGLGARGLIFTRLDTTRRLGSILSAMETGNMTLHHVSITPYVAQGIAPITPVMLARIFLEDPNEHDSFNELERASQ